jgi:urease accessory protein
MDAALPLERADGRLELAVRSDGGTTRLTHLRQCSPCRALFPRVESCDPLQAVLVNTSGGLVEGDRIQVEIAAGRAARLAVTTQAAEKVYRSVSATSVVNAALQLDSGARVEWRPQETILFERARLRRNLTAKVEGNARLLASECVIFGRAARLERFSRGLLHDGWRIYKEQKLAWADAVRLEEEFADRISSPFGFAGSAGYATIVYVGPDAASFLPLAREVAERGPWLGGASLVNGLLVVRALDTNEGRLRLGWTAVADALRAALGGDMVPT